MNLTRRTTTLLLALSMSPCAAGQSLTVNAVTNPALHGSATAADGQGPLGFATSDAFYVLGTGPGSIRTMSRWTPDNGLEIIGSTGPVGGGLPEFTRAVECGGWIYLAADRVSTCFGTCNGGIWRLPASGTGPMMSFSTNWPAGFNTYTSGMTCYGGQVYIVNNGHLGRLDTTTGVVTNLGEPFFDLLLSICADSTGVFVSSISKSIYRFEPISGTFTLIASIGVFGANYDIVAIGADAGTIVAAARSNYQGCPNRLLRIDEYSGNVVDLVVPCMNDPYFNLTVANDATNYFGNATSATGFFDRAVISVNSLGSATVLSPPPCEWIGPTAICEVRAFVVALTGEVRYLSRGTGGYTSVWAVATYSPIPFAAVSESISPSCIVPTSLTSTPPVLGGAATMQLHGHAGSVGVLAMGAPATGTIQLGGCNMLVDLAGLVLFPISTNANGDWSATLFLPPPLPILAGTKHRWQAALLTASGIEPSNGLDWTFGF